MTIINADDFGLSSSVNEAIASCFNNNLIHRTTIMANMPAFAEACELATWKGFKDKVGLHLDLDEGCPLTEKIKNNPHICKDGQYYNSWESANRNSNDEDLFFGSGGGTLFCPNELYPDLTNIEKARQLTPIADDIWLNTMTRLAKRKIIMIGNGMILPVFNPNNTTLYSLNCGQSENDRQLEAVIKEYGNVFRSCLT